MPVYVCACVCVCVCVCVCACVCVFGACVRERALCSCVFRFAHVLALLALQISSLHGVVVPRRRERAPPVNPSAGRVVARCVCVCVCACVGAHVRCCAAEVSES